MDFTNWGHLAPRYSSTRPRRLLALDGGGIRGLITLGILQQLEQKLADATGLGSSFRLCRFFDYIAGTSTGAIIATGLARGMTATELIDFYRRTGAQMFEKSSLLKRINSFYTADPLRAQLQEVFGRDTTLMPDYLNCLLMIVTRNATTDSAWPVSSNPNAKYNCMDEPSCNLRIPLWQLTRASTAAPVYFPPEVMQWDPHDDTKTWVFVDGGVTPYNNPAFQLYRMATLPEYRLGWATGERNLLLVSVGTGAADAEGNTAARPESNIVATVGGLPGTLMHTISVEQDFNCRTVGRCTYGAPIDSEVGDLIARDMNGAPLPVSMDTGRHFLYSRYNAELSTAGLAALGLGKLDARKMQEMDNVGNIEALREIGEAAGRHVDLAHFGEIDYASACHPLTVARSA